MNWYQIFYLFSVVDNLETFFGWMCAIFTIITLISWIVFIIYKIAVNTDGNEEGKDEEENLKIMRKWVWYATPLFIFFWLAYIAIPSKKDMLLIIAGGAVGEFVTNDDNAKQLPADITRFLRGEILKATADLTDEAKGTLGIQSEADKIKKMSREELEKLVLDKVNEKSETTNTP